MLENFTQLADQHMAETFGKRELRIMVLGHGGHGKDELCKLMGVKYESSSWAANRLFMFDLLKDKYGYKSLQECYDDRQNRREEWHDAICDYNKDDRARLAREMLKTSNVYCGIRCNKELTAIKAERLYDLYIWVDASGRLPLESKDSMKLTSADADIVVDNNGSWRDFMHRAKDLGESIGIIKKKVYIAGPYRGDTFESVDYNIAFARSLGIQVADMRDDWFPVVPHENTGRYERCIKKSDSYYLEGTMSLLDDCDAMLLLPGWERSSGTLGEIERANALRIPIYHSVDDLP